MTPLPRCQKAAGLFATSPALYATSGSFACKVAGCTYPSRRKDDEMKIAAARALAGLISDEELNEDYIIPKAFDPRVGKTVAAAVAEAARRTGVARI